MDLKIQVCARIRPNFTLDSEKSDIFCIDGSTIIQTTPYVKVSSTLNKIFGPSATQSELFAFTLPSLFSLNNGQNSTIIVYGTENSGKSFTLFGNDNEVGLISSSFSYVFQALSEKFDVFFTAFQVQQGEAYDLLKRNDSKMRHKLEEDAFLGTFFDGAEVCHVKSPEEAERLLEAVKWKIKINRNSMPSIMPEIICQIIVESKPAHGVKQVNYIKFCEVGIYDGIYPKNHLSNSMKRYTSRFDTFISAVTSGMKYFNNLDLLTSILKDDFNGRSRINLIGTLAPTDLNRIESIITLQILRNAMLIQPPNILPQIPSPHMRSIITIRQSLDLTLRLMNFPKPTKKSSNLGISLPTFEPSSTIFNKLSSLTLTT